MIGRTTQRQVRWRWCSVWYWKEASRIQRWLRQGDQENFDVNPVSNQAHQLLEELTEARQQYWWRYSWKGTWCRRKDGAEKTMATEDKMAGYYHKQWTWSWTAPLGSSEGRKLVLWYHWNTRGMDCSIQTQSLLLQRGERPGKKVARILILWWEEERDENKIQS